MATFLNWLALPDSAARWSALLSLQAGGFLGWITTPSLWIFAGPFRWFAMLGGLASAESAYDRDAVGDMGTSVGILQFGKASWTAVTGYVFPDAANADFQDTDPRLSPFQSGYVAAKYVRMAVVNTPRWWTLALPLYGFAVLRYMWTCGPSAACAERPAFDSTRISGTGAFVGKWDRMIGEGQRPSGAPTRGLVSFLAWRVLVMPLEAPLLVWGTSKTIRQMMKDAA